MYVLLYICGRVLSSIAYLINGCNTPQQTLRQRQSSLFQQGLPLYQSFARPPPASPRQPRWRFMRLGEVVGMRANNHRRAHGAGFDQVLPTVEQQAAADDGRIRCALAGEHYAHPLASTAGYRNST